MACRAFYRADGKIDATQLYDEVYEWDGESISNTDRYGVFEEYRYDALSRRVRVLPR